MACCSFYTELPEGWSQVPPIPEDKKFAADTLSHSIQANISLRHRMPEEYHAHVGVRILVIALLIIGISAGVMALQGTLTSFPQNFVRFFQNVNWNQAGIGLGVFTVLTGAAAILIYKVKHQQDPLTGKDSGGFTGDSPWISAVYHSDKHGTYAGYLDTATLDENRNGYAFMYILKDEQGHYIVSATVCAITPVHMVAAVAYNAIRIAIIPFYILGCLAYESCTGKELEKGRPFTINDIPVEMAKSVWRIVKAPFYAVAFIYAALYSLIDPLNGRKLGSYLERDWNEGVTRSEGYWSVGGPQALWYWEGRGTPSGLGRNGFYLAGCWQPIARVKYDNGDMTAESLSHAVNRLRGQIYKIYEPVVTAQRHEKWVTELNRVIKGVG